MGYAGYADRSATCRLLSHTRVLEGAGWMKTNFTDTDKTARELTNHSKSRNATLRSNTESVLEVTRDGGYHITGSYITRAEKGNRNITTDETERFCMCTCDHNNSTPGSGTSHTSRSVECNKGRPHRHPVIAQWFLQTFYL